MSGRHAHRSPLRYRALAGLFADMVAPVARPDQADMYVFAHSIDIMEAPRAVVEDWRARRRPVVLLSEEPFWDTVWTRRPLERDIVIETGYGALPVVQISHHTSDIFRFEAIPYYLLTNNRFVNAYRWRFARNAAYGAQHWRRAFAGREYEVTFMFERRPGAQHDVRWDGGDITGLCAWRTTLAENCRGGGVRRLGQSWQGGASRFDLKNWHFDKLMQLDGSSRSLAAIENTHQPDYLTEKLFDAFACGARPLYFASPGHGIHRLGLPETSWLNLGGLTPQEAAGQVARPFADSGFCEAFHLAQRRLAALFGDTGLVLRERRRLRAAVSRELQTVLETQDRAVPEGAGTCDKPQSILSQGAIVR